MDLYKCCSSSGLEKSLCKYGHLDERSIYETRERYLGIMFHRRRDRWRTSSNVSLTLKFVSFQNEGKDRENGLKDISVIYMYLLIITEGTKLF